MILDMQNLLSDQQSLAQAAGNYLSTNAIDLWGSATAPAIPGLGGSVIKDVGRGNEPELLIQVTEQVASAGASTVQFQLVQADDAALGTNMEVLAETPAIGKAALVPGYQARLCIPPGVTRRYLGTRYVVAVATNTAGKVTAGIVGDRQTTFVG